MAYWITFKDGSGACIEEANPAVRAAEITGKEVAACDSLPYPANPRIGEQSSCPPFCYTPKQCKGRGCCPKSYACSE